MRLHNIKILTLRGFSVRTCVATRFSALSPTVSSSRNKATRKFKIKKLKIEYLYHIWWCLP